MIDFKKCEGIIFDLDGTLIDSMGVWEQIDIDFLGKRGFEVPDDYLDRIAPLGFEACADYTIERFGLRETRQQIMKEWFDMAEYAYSHEVTLKKGVFRFLEYLKNHHIKMSIATASNMTLVKPVLKRHHIWDYFDNITTLKEVKRGKGFPDVYDLAADKMHVNRKHCVVFEDIREGLIGAKAGGYKAVGVYDERAKEQVEDLKGLSDMFIYDFNECIC